MKSIVRSFFACVFLAAAQLATAEGLEPALQEKLNGLMKDLQALASDPTVVKAVKAHNATLPAEHASLTQEKWSTLKVLDPLVRSFTQNEAAQLLKSKKSEAASEAFLSDASGMKVAFLSKTSNWSHKGKAKHEDPMAGKVWQGPIEVDESSGLQQVQIGVPVMDGGKPIGSLVMGFSLSKLGGK